MTKQRFHLDRESDASVLVDFYSGVKSMDDFIHNHPLFLSVDALCTEEYSAVGFYDKCRFWAAEYMNVKLDTLRMYRTM